MKVEKGTLLKLIDDEQLSWVGFVFVDATGRSHVRYAASEELKSSIHVSLHDGIPMRVSNSLHVGALQGNCAVLIPDLDHVVLRPDAPGEKRQLDILGSLAMPAADPRRMLREVADNYAKQGLRLMVGLSIEMGVTDGCSLGGDPLADRDREAHSALRMSMAEAIADCGGKLEYMSATGPSSMDFDFIPISIEDAADITFLGMRSASILANQAGAPLAITSHTGKTPFRTEIHQSVWSIEPAKNQFFDPSGELHLSNMARAYASGIMTHIVSLCALSVTNSRAYEWLVRRLQCVLSPSEEMAAVYTPSYYDETEKRDRGGWSKRLACCWVPTSRSYHILLAALGAAGLEGIQKSGRQRCRVEQLPSYSDAVSVLREDDTMRSVFGNLLDVLCDLRLAESNSNDSPDTESTKTP